MVKRKGWSDEQLQFLLDNYKKLSSPKIAEELNKSVTSIKKALYDLGLRRRSKDVRDSRKDSIEEINSMSVGEVPLEVAYKHKGWLVSQYIGNQLTTTEIAELTGCTRKNVSYWLKKFNVESRRSDNISDRTRGKMSEANKGRAPFSKGLTKHDHPSIMSTSQKLSGCNGSNWHGGTYITNTGYRFVVNKTHPHRNSYGYVFEHRLVMEEHTGRLLETNEVVHHRDHNRLNNDINNLFLFPSNSAHSSFHNYKKHIDITITEEEFMERVYRK